MTTTETMPVKAGNKGTAEEKPAKQKTLKELLEGEAFKAQVAKTLPAHLGAERFIRVAMTAMMRVPKLAQCEQASFFKCLLDLSAMGLEPDGRHAHLIPRENRKRGVVECTLIVDYKGLVALAMRGGQVQNIHADVVCENDVFKYNLGEIVAHEIDFRKPRGKVYAAYAIARFKDASPKCEVLGVEEVEAVRKRSRAGDDGPWVTDWNEMAKKTAFRRLSKWLPLSAEVVDAMEKDGDRIDTEGVIVPPEAEVRQTRVADRLRGKPAAQIAAPAPTDEAGEQPEISDADIENMARAEGIGEAQRPLTVEELVKIIEPHEEKGKFARIVSKHGVEPSFWRDATHEQLTAIANELGALS